MQIIGFNFTKISGERSSEFKNCPITTNIELKDIQKEEVPLLAGKEAVKILFNYSLLYGEKQEDKEEKQEPLARIDLNGQIVLATTKEEIKEIQKLWKKKKISTSTQVPLYNVIMKKTAPKAIQLQDELNLHSHIPLPKVELKKQE